MNEGGLGAQASTNQFRLGYGVRCGLNPSTPEGAMAVVSGRACKKP